MSILTQKTISKKISFSGLGIHSGKKVNMSVLPAAPNTGIIFKRVDLKKNNLIFPLYNNVVVVLCTTIQTSMELKFQLLSI